MPWLFRLAYLSVLVATVGGSTTAHVGALGDSTPFTEFADTSYASLSSFASHGAQTEAACMKICEDDPNCASFVMNGGNCDANTDDQFTIRRLDGVSLYKKVYRVQTVTTPAPLKIKSMHDLLCLENPRNSDLRLTTYECDDHINRRWTLPRVTSYINMRHRSFHIESSAGEGCVEATSAADETLLELQSCDSSTGHTNKNQRWQLLETNQLRNERLGRCLELDDQKVVTLQICDNDKVQQHWLISTNAPGRLEFQATRIDEVNTGDQRWLFNPHLNLDRNEVQCTDCPEHTKQEGLA